MDFERLNVIALISGGKDSFYSLLHCIQNGHRIVALANLYPPTTQEHTDLNSFMYQTVGHEIIPLYAEATDIPLYRHAIQAGAACHDRDYAFDASRHDTDETESMLPLLRRIQEAHPESNALCSGAILSTYQRTRVESVALRLGLTPLAYLWKYPVLPSPAGPRANESQLLIDMAAAGLDARIIKVASAGLDKGHLWQRVSGELGSARVRQSLRRFGAVRGAAIGEGGEFETLVLDGPDCLFKKCISVPDDGRAVVDEGGGASWLLLRGAQLLEKMSREDDQELNVRVPELYDAKFAQILKELTPQLDASPGAFIGGLDVAPLSKPWSTISNVEMASWNLVSDTVFDKSRIRDETANVVGRLRDALAAQNLDAAQLTTVYIIIRNMADFSEMNGVYGQLFQSPNPASRVTLSSGDLLPAGHNIMMYATAPLHSAATKRDGLHVQSRSYWAPANIGPYSQAIEIPLMQSGRDTGLRSVFVAGQIPLVPHTMVLPPPSTTSLAQHITLSLQHLWRIGIEMKVQLWTSAVAYFDRSTSDDDMRRKAVLAGRAWAMAHVQKKKGQEEGEEGEYEDIDPWDLKYNTQYMSLGGAEDNEPRPLPDTDVFFSRQQSEPETCVPAVFAVEVEQLPKKSPVEWHAHAGLSGISDASTQLVTCAETQLEGWRAWSTMVRTTGDSGGGMFLHTVVAGMAGFGVGEERGVEADMAYRYRDVVRRLGVESDVLPGPYMVYLDRSGGPYGGQEDEKVLDGSTPTAAAIVPCHSIWTADGKRALCVGLYRAMVTTLS